MPLFSHFKTSTASDDEIRQVTARAPRDDSRLRDFCKAKAEVIVSGETTHALREFLNPFKEK